MQFLKEREGLSRKPDYDGYGTYTLGYGVNYPSRVEAMRALRRLGAQPGRLTDAQATPDLIRKICEKEERLQGVLNARGHKVWDRLTDYQQDSVRSLFYNLAERSGVPFLQKYINGDRVRDIPAAMARYTGSWSEANRNGLSYRRRMEVAMFQGRNALGARGPTIADTIQGRHRHDDPYTVAALDTAPDVRPPRRHVRPDAGPGSNYRHPRGVRSHYYGGPNTDYNDLPAPSMRRRRHRRHDVTVAEYMPDVPWNAYTMPDPGDRARPVAVYYGGWGGGGHVHVGPRHRHYPAAGVAL